MAGTQSAEEKTARILEGFREYFPEIGSLPPVEGWNELNPEEKELLDKKLAKLVWPKVQKSVYRKKHNKEPSQARYGSWPHAARNFYKEENQTNGRWYEQVLPNIFLNAGFASSIEEGREVSQYVYDLSYRTRDKKISKVKSKATEEEAIEKFRETFAFLKDLPPKEKWNEMPSAEFDRLKEKIVGLGSNKAKKIKIGRKKTSIYQAGIRLYKDKNRIEWFETILPNYIWKAGFAPDFEKALELSKMIKGIISTEWHKKAGESHRLMTREEALKLFKEEYPFLAKATKLKDITADDLRTLSFIEIRKAHDAGKAEWFYALKREYGGGNWYDFLPDLIVQVRSDNRKETSRKDAEALVKRIREYQSDALKTRMSKLQLKTTKEQMLRAFVADFPCVLRDIRNPPEDAISGLYTLNVIREAKGQKLHWYNAALTKYRSPKGRHGAWYRDVLPNLVADARRLFGYEVKQHEIDGFVAKARKVGEEKRIRKPAGTKEKTGKAAKYAITVKSSFGGKGSTVSFAGIENVLSIDSVSTSRESAVGIPRAVISGAKKMDASKMSKAQLLRFKMRESESWGGKMPEEYAKDYPFIAPYLTTRLQLLHLFGLVKNGKIGPLTEGASFMSGPGEVYQAMQDLKGTAESTGIKIPRIIDIDSEEGALEISKNPNKLSAVLPDSKLPEASLDFVECSSLYQFSYKKNRTIVRDTIIEAHRVLKEGGVVLLASNGKEFCAEFGESMKKLGFDIITPPNTKLWFSDGAQQAVLEAMGLEVLEKSIRAADAAFVLVAVKNNEQPLRVLPESMRFIKPESLLPEEIRPILKHARNLNRCVTDEQWHNNISIMEGILLSKSEDFHLENAQLIQTAISKYMLDNPPNKPKKDELYENATKQANSLIPLINEKPKTSADKYFNALGRLTRIHRERIAIQSQKVQKLV